MTANPKLLIAYIISLLVIIQARPPEFISGDEIGLLPPEEPNAMNSTNLTAQNLYVIRAVVYEIGILTDVGENETDTNETLTNEKLDFTFFNPGKNGSIIDLSDIHSPIQANITGQVITGLAPIDLEHLTNITGPNILTGFPMQISEVNMINSNEDDEKNNTILNSITSINSAISSIPFTVSNQTVFSTSLTNPQ